MIALVSKEEPRSQKVLNALTLLACDEGKQQPSRSENAEIAWMHYTSRRKIDRIKKRFVLHGLDVALGGRKGSRICEGKADGDFEAYLVAVVPTQLFAQIDTNKDRLCFDDVFNERRNRSCTHGRSGP